MVYNFFHWNKMVNYMPIADSPAIEKRQLKAKSRSHTG